MKKENRKMAQQRRAEERRKKEFRRKLSKALAIGIPILVIVILVVVLVIYSNSSSDSSGSSSNDTSTSSSSDTGSTADDGTDISYSTDTSLTVEDGDTVNIDYVGTVDGVEFDGGSTQGMGTDLVIGSGSYIDDFEDQLIGAHPGETVEVNVTFPDAGISLLYRFPFYKYSPALFSLTNSLSPCLVIFWDRKYPI